MSKLEYLDENYKLHVIDGESEAVPEGWILVPEGVDLLSKILGDFVFYKIGNPFEWFCTEENIWWKCDDAVDLNSFDNILWQRESKSEVVEEKLDVKKMVAQIEVDMATMGSYSHYFKDVRHLTILDVYRVLKLFEVYDPCIQHAVKKLLCGGKRGAKNVDSDIKEAIDSLVRFQEMRKEDNNG